MTLIIYFVKKGDTLFELAERYQVDIEHLKAMNPQLSQLNELQLGTKVKIPSIKKEERATVTVSGFMPEANTVMPNPELIHNQQQFQFQQQMPINQPYGFPDHLFPAY